MTYNKYPITMLTSTLSAILNNTSIAKQFKCDANLIQHYVSDITTIRSSLSVISRDIMKRLCMIICEGELTYRASNDTQFMSVGKKNQTLHPSQPPFTVAASFGHGSRNIIIIPKLKSAHDDPKYFIAKF